MNYRNMPPEVHKLSTIPGDWTRKDWFNYSELGLTSAHIPMLIEIVRNSKEFWGDDVDDGEYYVPLHAWRALGQMQAQEAIPVLIDTLAWIDEIDSDLIQEEMPDVFGRMGIAAAPMLSAYLSETGNELWGRLVAAEGIAIIAGRIPTFRDEAVQVLTRALDRFEQEDPVFNGFIINFLSKLNATEAAPLIEAAYRSGRVDDSIPGDWEDFQVNTGMLPQRRTQRYHRQLFQDAFTDGVYRDLDIVVGDLSQGEPTPENKKAHALELKTEKKEKKKRKEAKSKRKKNSKK